MPENALADLVRKLPATPGVYQFFDAHGKILYIGKAKNLKNRVRTYFQATRDASPKTEKMLSEARDLKWIETNSEVEALVLETNLVKEHQPKFNVLLRDDKHFLYFKVTTNEAFPRVLEVRRVEKDDAKYFGPKTNAASVHDTLKLIKKLFHLRTCSLGIEERDGKIEITKKTLDYPCLDSHIGLCPAPCAGKILRAEYDQLVADVLEFLGGNTSPILTSLRERMRLAAERKEFELAARLRDQITAIQNVGERQLVSDPSLASRDVIGVVLDGAKAYFALLEIRNGKLIEQKNFEARTGESELAEVLAEFLIQYYALATEFPREILLPEEIPEVEVLEEFFNDTIRKRGGANASAKTKILFPQRGRKEGLLRLAEKNAAAFRVQTKAKFENATERTLGAAKELAEALGISRELKRIEAYDISHLSGTATVGSMTVFGRGEPKNADYRHFKIRTLESGKIDDYASLAEIVGRRMNYLVEQNRDIKFRGASKKDTKFLEAIRFRDWDTQEIIDNLKDFMLAEKDGKIIGRAKIHFWKEQNLYGIYNLWVDPEHRGQKIGHELIKRLLKKSKAPKAYLSCVPNLKDYYEFCGFKELRQVPEFFLKNSERYYELHPEKKTELIWLVWSRKEQKKDPSFHTKPELVILDGGKGQLSAVLRSVQFPKTTTVVALAKREEEIFKKDEVGTGFEKIQLPKDSNAFFLVTRIRDEAHRFANRLRESVQKNAMFG